MIAGIGCNMWVVRHDVDVDGTAPFKARRFVAGSVRGCAGADRIDDVVLLTSELVTNALDHGAAPVTLDIYCDEGSLSIEVHDAGNRQPEVDGLACPTADRGRGLGVVAALADEWGVTRESTGKTVWFRFNAHVVGERQAPAEAARANPGD